MTYSQWILDFLNAIGAPATPSNIAFMNAWIAKESGQYPISYGWNPLNTTHPYGGSTGGGAQGNIQFFPNYLSGLYANVQTITSGLYPDLLAALRGGNASTATTYAGLNTWGTHSLAGFAGSTPPASSSSSNPMAQPIFPGGQSAAQYALSKAPNPVSGAINYVVANGTLVFFALVFFAIGGTWLIFGNKTTAQAAGNTVRIAKKAATIAAA